MKLVIWSRNPLWFQVQAIRSYLSQMMIQSGSNDLRYETRSNPTAIYGLDIGPRPATKSTADSAWESISDSDACRPLQPTPYSTDPAIQFRPPHRLHSLSAATATPTCSASAISSPVWTATPVSLGRATSLAYPRLRRRGGDFFAHVFCASKPAKRLMCRLPSWSFDCWSSK